MSWSALDPATVLSTLGDSSGNSAHGVWESLGGASLSRLRHRTIVRLVHCDDHQKSDIDQMPAQPKYSRGVQETYEISGLEDS
jgi:hypothetical protein